MSPILRKQQLARSQAETLKFSAGLVLAAMFLYYGRNIVRFGMDVPNWHMAVAVVTVGGCVAIALLAYANRVHEQYAQLAGATLALLHGLATLSNIMAGLNPGVYSSSLAVMVFGIAVLSERVFIASLLVFLCAWFPVISTQQNVGDWVPIAVFVAVSTAISTLVLRYRIEAKLAKLKMLDRIDELESFLSLCANCRKLRDGKNWITLEHYMKHKEGKEVSHGICPQCTEELYGDVLRKNKQRIKQLESESAD